MPKLILTLLLACFAVPAWAGLCQDCPDPGEPGGGGTLPPLPPSPVKLKLAKVDPSQGTITLQLTNGGTIVIDDDLNKMWVSSANKNAELNLSTVLLQWAGGNATKANAFRARIHSLASTNVKTNTLVRGAPVQGLMMGLPGGTPWGCYFNPFYCDVKPHNDFDGGGGGGGWGTYSYGFYGPPGASTGGSNTNDYNYWKHFRDDACATRETAGRGMVMGTITLIASCPFFETGAGAVICGVSALSIVDHYETYTNNSGMRLSPYPGPGNW